MPTIDIRIFDAQHFECSSTGGTTKPGQPGLHVGNAGHVVFTANEPCDIVFLPGHNFAVPQVQLRSGQLTKKAKLNKIEPGQTIESYWDVVVLTDPVPRPLVRVVHAQVSGGHKSGSGSTTAAATLTCSGDPDPVIQP
jgi:hypothetical protein